MSDSDSSTSPEENAELLKKLCVENAEYFSRDSSENGQRLYISFLGIKDTLEQIWPTVTHVREVSPKYDMDENSPGNGFRSFVSVFDSAVKYAIDLNNKVSSKREGLLFRKTDIKK